MEYFYIALIVILLSISIGLFFNYLINSTEKRIQLMITSLSIINQLRD